MADLVNPKDAAVQGRGGCDAATMHSHRSSSSEQRTMLAPRMHAAVSTAQQVSASSAPAPRAWRWRRISSSAASPSTAWNASRTSAGFGILPLKAASSTRRRTSSPPSAPPASTTCRCWTRTTPNIRAMSRVLGYFRDFVAKFGLAPHIELGKRVERVAPRRPACGRWRSPARASRASTAAWWWRAAITMCRACRPIPAQFSGEIVHSRQLQEPEAGARQARAGGGLRQLGGRHRVGCRARPLHRCSSASAAATGSCRSSSWASPPATSSPTSRCCRCRGSLKRWLFQGTLWLLQGPPSRYRMPDPDYAIDQAHPTMTDEIPRLVAHGKLTVKPEIARFDGSGSSSRTARRRRSTRSCLRPATSRSSRSWTRA